MKISIIIPIYRVEAYISACLQSVIDQTYRDIECLLIDDASPDKSILIVKEILEQSERKEQFRIITHEKNRGLSAARNTGIRNATGDYLFFLDSDDMIHPACIETLVQKANASNPDFVISEYDLLGSSDAAKYPKIGLEDNTLLCGAEIAEGLYRKQWYGMAWNKLVKRTFLMNEHCLFYEGIVHEDILWSFLLANKSTQMAVCTESTYIYRIRPESITQQMTERNFSSLLVVLQEIAKMILTISYDEQKSTCVFDYLADQRIYLFKEWVRAKKDKKYIRERCSDVNQFFADPIFSHRSNYSFSSLLKILPYKLPSSIAIAYVKGILWIQRNVENFLFRSSSE